MPVMAVTAPLPAAGAFRVKCLVFTLYSEAESYEFNTLPVDGTKRRQNVLLSIFQQLKQLRRII